MRKYARIWTELKDNKSCIIEADISLHPRILNAIRKEKCRDLAFKYLSAELGNTYRLAYDIEGTKILFTLHPEKSIRNL
jgi:hypothetical protein